MKKNRLHVLTRTLLVLLFCAAGVTSLQAQLFHPLYYQAEQKTTGAGINPAAMLLMDFEQGDVSYWTCTNTGQNRGEQQSIELADREKGDPVRFGRYAVKLNWDFTAAVPAQTLGSYFNPSGGTAANPRFQIPAGTGPRIMGFWLYASPECATARLWVRPQIQAQGATGSGVAAPAAGNMISVPTAGSGYGMAEVNPPNWTGWKYVYFDWNSATNGSLATQALGPPASASPSYALFRIMQTSTAADQRPLIKGYFIIDNIRFTSVSEDYTAPAISAVTGNGTNLLTNTATFTKAGSITLKANFSDTGTSGINIQSAIFAVNGVIYTHGDAGFSADATSVTFTKSFRPGTHSVQAYIEDNFGNITAREVTFTVNDPDFVATNILLEPEEDAFVGREFKMDVVTDRTENVKELDLNFQWDMLASVAATGAVEFAPSVTGSYTYSNGRLNVKLQNDNTAASGTKKLATIKVTIDKKIYEDEVFRCNPGKATATYGNDEIDAFNFFSTFERVINQDYRTTIVKLITGSPGEILVTDLADGSPLAGATVYLGSGTGVTGSNGIASITVPSGQFDIVAEKAGKYSFTKTTKALTPILTTTPEGIRSGTNIDNTTSKTITWMTAPSALPAIMKIAKESDGEGAFVEHTGETKDLNYASSANVAKGNKVSVTGLEPGTTYIYQVGDGTNWSPTRKFTTTTVTNKFSFATFGDHQMTQATDLPMFLAAANTVGSANPKPFFFLNVGDNSDTDDNSGNQTQYASLLDQRPDFANINLTPAYGNHEYMGYSGNLKFMNGHPSPEPSANYNINQVGDGSYYSIYGNMIVFGLDWEVNGIVRQTEQAKWIDEVLTAHPDITWRIVTLHYPIWPSASSSGSRAAFDALFEKHHVNVVFCGHGHTYRRALVKNSTVISNLGPSVNYPDVNSADGVLHWELGGIRPSDGASQKWAFAEVDNKKMSFTVRDGSNNVTNQSFVLYHQDYSEVKVNFSTPGNGTIAAKVNDIAITDGAMVQKDKEVVFTATPSAGYVVKEWKLNGTPVDGNATNTYKVNVPAATTVTVEFKEAEKYAVTFSAVNGENGTLTATVDEAPIASGDMIQEDKEVVFSATPSDGYAVKEWKLNGTLVEGNATNTYKINITAATTVTVEFKEVAYTVTFSAVNGENGTLTATVDETPIDSGDKVEKGKDVVFTAASAEKYEVKEWKLNSVIIEGNKTDTYLLENLSAAATVTVEFQSKVGIESIFALYLDIYPNPFENTINIIGAEDAVLQVMNVTGVVVYTQEIGSADESINLSRLSAGMYFFRLQKDGEIKTIKVMKK